jgi:hypothetical protein
MRTTSLSQAIGAVALFVLPTIGYAQNSGEGSEWTITPRAGITISTLTGDYAKGDAYDPRLGFGGGIEAEYHINKTLGLSIGAFYTKQGAKRNFEILTAASSRAAAGTIQTGGPNTIYQEISGHDAHFNISDYTDKYEYVNRTLNIKTALGYINIPLMLNVHLPFNLPVVITAKAGTQLDILVYAKDKGKEQIYYRGTYSNSSYSSPSLKGSLKDFGISIPLGLAVSYKNIELDARYLWNVTDINDINMVDGGDSVKAHTSTFLITLGYNFNL